MPVLLNESGACLMNAGEPTQGGPTEPLAQAPDERFVWCMVANMTREPHPEGPDHTMRLGTRLFAPGAKVYCCPILWGDGGERLRVVGRHRRGRKLIVAVVPTKLLINWRAQRVFDPQVVD